MLHSLTNLKAREKGMLLNMANAWCTVYYISDQCVGGGEKTAILSHAASSCGAASKNASLPKVKSITKNRMAHRGEMGNLVTKSG